MSRVSWEAWTALALIVIAVFTVWGLVKYGRMRLKQHGVHALSWRWVSAKAHHGKAVTTRGWTRPGRPTAKTDTGYAHRRWYWPRWQHALWRIENTFLVALLVVTLVFQFRRTIDYLTAVAAAATGYGTWRAWEWAQMYGHRKNRIKPAHVRLHELCEIPLALQPEDWLEIPKHGRYATATWPKQAALPDSKKRQTIADAFALTLGMGDAVPTWKHAGPRLQLRLDKPIPCPDHVTLEDILDALRTALWTDLIVGIGQGGPELGLKRGTLSLLHDSPHLGLSCDTGKGKSVTIRCMLSQLLLRGAIAAILDNKLVSHPWARGLPNVAYCDDIEKIHDFLVWLDGELTRRAVFIAENTDAEGNLFGDPGPPLAVVIEELNLLSNRLRSYWAQRIAEDRALPKDQRENLPTTSPALVGLENATHVGRELKVHLLYVSQRMTASALGGGNAARGAAIRQQLGIRALAGWDEDSWDMLVGRSVPMPAPSKRPGRMQIVVKGGDGPHEVQIAFFTNRQARDLALAGTATVPRSLEYLTVSRFRPRATGATPVAPPASPAPARRPVAPGTPPDLAAIAAGLPPSSSAPGADMDFGDWITIAEARKAGFLGPGRPTAHSAPPSTGPTSGASPYPR